MQNYLLRLYLVHTLLTRNHASLDSLIKPILPPSKPKRPQVRFRRFAIHIQLVYLLYILKFYLSIIFWTNLYASSIQNQWYYLVNVVITVILMNMTCTIHTSCFMAFVFSLSTSTFSSFIWRISWIRLFSSCS